MRTAAQWIDLARDRAHLPSDYAIAAELDVSRQLISMLRAGKASVGEHLAERLGELAGVDGGIVYAECKATRAKRTEIRQFWTRIARGLTAGLCVVISGGYVAEARGDQDGTAWSRIGDGIHIMRNAVRALARRLAARLAASRGAAGVPPCYAAR